MPDQKLIRDSAGSYHTAEDRFTVTKEGTSWWVRDGALQDELGMARVSGPFGTLDEVRTSIAEAETPPKSKPATKASRRKKG